MSVRYPAIPYGPAGAGLTVEHYTRVNELRLEELNSAIIDLKRAAYHRQLEMPGGPLRADTVDRLYTPAVAGEATLRGARNTLHHGGAYHIVRSPDNPNEIDGLASTYPIPPIIDEGSYVDPDFEVYYILRISLLGIRKKALVPLFCTPR